MTTDRKALSELLTLRRELVEIENDREYSQITLRLYGRGATRRLAVSGSDLGSRRFRASAGQLIVSKIDARNGALDIVPEALDGCIVSADFLTYDISSCLDRDYLRHIIRTAEFVQACVRASEGSTNRVRLKEDRFLQIEVPVPSVDEQRSRAQHADRLLQVNRDLESSARAFPAGDSLYQAAVDEVVSIAPGNLGGAEMVLDGLRRRWGAVARPSYNNADPGVRKAQGDGALLLPEGWMWASLGAVCTEIVDCINDTPDFEDNPTSFLGLKTTNVRPNRLTCERRWYLGEEAYLKWNRRTTPASRDIILTREAPMGMVALVPVDLRVALTQRLVLLRTDPELMSPEFLCHMLNSRAVQRAMTLMGRSSPPHLRVRDIPHIPVPLCGVELQRSITARLDRVYGVSRGIESELTAQLSNLAALSEQVRREVLV